MLRASQKLHLFFDCKKKNTKFQIKTVAALKRKPKDGKTCNSFVYEILFRVLIALIYVF